MQQAIAHTSSRIDGIDPVPASRLRSLRLAARLSQTDLASLSHIPQSHISAFESGARRPGPRRAARIAAVLGVEAEELFR